MKSQILDTLIIADEHGNYGKASHGLEVVTLNFYYMNEVFKQAGFNKKQNVKVTIEKNKITFEKLK